MAKIVVGVGEYAVSRNQDDEIRTFALGSCVAVIFLDPKTRTIGMAHIALPESRVDLDKANALPTYFADTGIPYLLEKMKEYGSKPDSDYIIKIVGGAKVVVGSDHFAIGQRNVTEIKRVLWQLNLSIKAEDVGKEHSRTVTVSLKTGKVYVSSHGRKWSV